MGNAGVDVYGLGCVGYWLLTGERLFAGRTAVEVLMHHVKTPPVPPSQRSGRAIPADLEALVLACLAKEPRDRPPSAEWLAKRLAGCRTAQDWTPERAREWWTINAPGAAAGSREAGATCTAGTPVVPVR